MAYYVIINIACVHLSGSIAALSFEVLELSREFTRNITGNVLAPS